MRILHYSLGFPPFRTGGMTKYCLDLMEEQAKTGHTVGMLWPGKIEKYDSRCEIKKRRRYSLSSIVACGNYELVNPLPISLLNGITDVDAYTAPKAQKAFDLFFKMHNPDIFHIHTLMGLPKELLIAAKNNGVRIVFSTHDYFGICPRTSLVFGNHICEYSSDCRNCDYCNKGALSLKKIRMIQSPLYRAIKDNGAVKKLRKNAIAQQRERSEDIDKILETESENTYDWSRAAQYEELREYYYSCFELCDVVHFNSSVTEAVYRKHNVPINKGNTISITHAGLKNHRIKKEFSDTIRFSYLGAFSTRKGCEILIQAMDEVYKHGYRNFKLNVFAPFPYQRDYIVQREPYRYDQIKSVFEETDVLILPSIWYETFGFTVLEALSYDVPVVVSNHAGAKDLVTEFKNGWLTDPNKEQLAKTIQNILSDGGKVLNDMNSYMCDYGVVKTMNEHTKEIMEKCYQQESIKRTE